MPVPRNEYREVECMCYQVFSGIYSTAGMNGPHFNFQECRGPMSSRNWRYLQKYENKAGKRLIKTVHEKVATRKDDGVMRICQDHFDILVKKATFQREIQCYHTKCI